MYPLSNTEPTNPPTITNLPLKCDQEKLDKQKITKNVTITTPTEEKYCSWVIEQYAEIENILEIVVWYCGLSCESVIPACF